MIDNTVERVATELAAQHVQFCSCEFDHDWLGMAHIAVTAMADHYAHMAEYLDEYKILLMEVIHLRQQLARSAP